MKTTEKHLEELPDMSFVQTLAATDLEFQHQFISTLKEEFTTDYVVYLYHMELDEPRSAAELAAKLKYVLSFLGMNAAFIFAERHEEKLALGDSSSHAQFKKILTTVQTFLSKY